MKDRFGILAFTTSNYDGMKRFLVDFGFEVSESSDPLLPLFGQARGSRVRRGDIDFNLEETAGGDRAVFHLFLPDYSEADIQRIKSLGYASETAASVYGDFHSFQTPDGGVVVLC